MTAAEQPGQPACSVCGGRPATRVRLRGSEVDPAIEAVADGAWRRRFTADAGDWMCEECFGRAEPPESVA